MGDPKSVKLRTWQVDSVPLRDLLVHNDYQKVNFLKIDVEGAEYDLASSIAELLADQPDITLFLGLHPHIIARSGVGFVNKILRSPYVFMKRIIETMRIFKAIRRLPNFYLPDGSKVTAFHILRPRNLRGPIEFVATTRSWNS